MADIRTDMSPETFFRMIGLQLGKYRPPEIADLEAKIKREKAAFVVCVLMTRVVDQERSDAIDRMNLELSNLYLDWAEGRIS